ncbi:MAG: ATP synthase F1 subunit gamma [Bacteroidia bacterium]|nr:ATP synthase F1 subunit gamma [Bacteroidia bacterium]
MANLKEIRGRIKTVQNTQQVTKAMKMVAAAKLRKATDRMIQLRPYAAKMKNIIGNVVSALNIDEIPSKLVEQRPVKNVLLVIVSSNRGLCGPFNANLFRFTNQYIQENLSSFKQSGNLHAICLGKKGFDYFSKRGIKMVDGKNFDVLTQLSFERVNEVTERIFDGFINGEWDKVVVMYNEFKNVMSQNRIAEPFLPITIEQSATPVKSANTDYIFEPGREKILVDLIPNSLKIRLYRSVLESNASEQGSRMVAMDQATENGNALLKELKLKYNKARQAAITKEILEIAGGADALANA